MSGRFVEVEHTADIAIRASGGNLSELFANAAYGLACQLAETANIEQTVEKRIEVTANDTEELLVTFLNELVYLLERDGSVFLKFCVREISDSHLIVSASGGQVSERRHSIKAVTFNDLEVIHSCQGYEATIVFDV